MLSFMWAKRGRKKNIVTPDNFFMVMRMVLYKGNLKELIMLKR